jgi:hypothetical protein
MAAVMRVRRSTSVTGSGGTKTRSSMKPHKKKSHGVRSGERRGQRIILDPRSCTADLSLWQSIIEVENATRVLKL